MKNKQNIYQGLPADLSAEVLETLVQGNNIRIERIVSQGQASPEGFWYDQDEHEWVMLLQGHAILGFSDHQLELKAGDYVHIPAHQKHRVEWTSPHETTLWLAVFYS